MSPAAGRAWVALAVLCLLAFSAWGAHLVVGVRGERAEVAARVQALAALDALENGHPAPLPDLVTARPDGTALKAALDAHDVREAREHVRALEAALRAENGVLSARLGERLRNLGFLVALSVGLGFVVTGLLAHTVTRERALAEALATAARERERALIADGLKDRLLANVAHELRSPLARMLGLVELARLSRRDSDLEEAMRHGRELGRLLGDLLDLAALEAGAITFRPAPTDVAALIEDVVGQARAKGAEMRVETSLPPLLSLDPVRLKQLVRNLVQNAVRHGAGRPVEVHAGHEGTELVLRVRDHGDGLPEGADLFRAFERGGVEGRGGLGVGLAIVGEIVEQWGGTIRLEDAEGGGALAEVRVRAILAVAPEASAAPPSIGRVLVVEDDPTLLVVTRAVLSSRGFTVEAATTGEDALERLERQPDADVVLVDWQLPGLQGPDVARRLRESGSVLPLVAITARARPQDVEACRDAGFDAHMAKPVDWDALVGLLDRLLEERRSA